MKKAPAIGGFNICNQEFMPVQRILPLADRRR
jgi:hypothetical protein